MTKFLMLLFGLITTVSLCSCGSEIVEEKPQKLFVTFKNYDDTVLYHTKIDYGTVPTYFGDVPVREPTQSTYFSFCGWDKNINEPLYDNTIFYAQYDEETRKYVVTFENYDGSVLETKNVEYGTYTSYTGSTPTKSSDDRHIEYIFSGWDVDISKYKIVNDAIFIAQYSMTEYTFASFYNYDDSLLKEEKIVKGNYAEYNGPEPTKPSSDQHIEYEFDGWDKDLSSYKMNVDTDFKAKYKTVDYVFAKFYGDGNCLLQEVKVKKGESASYSGTLPTKSYSGTDKVYRFSGWDKSLDSLNSDTDFYAQFDLLNVYTVTFENYDGSVLQVKKVVHGDDVEYTGSTPYRAGYTSGQYQYSYTFKGWDHSLSNVTSSFTTIAQFNQTYVYIKSDVEKVRDYLDSYGSGSYHIVSTGSGTTLGYSGSYFYLSYTDFENGFTVAGNFAYGDSYIYCSFELTYEGMTVYKGTTRAYVSGHKFNYLNGTNISVCLITDDETLLAAAQLTNAAIKVAIDNCSDYLYSKGLPYIY